MLLQKIGKQIDLMGFDPTISQLWGVNSTSVLQPVTKNIKGKLGECRINDWIPIPELSGIIEAWTSSREEKQATTSSFLLEQKGQKARPFARHIDELKHD